MAFMDDDGLRYLWSKIKGLFNRGITALSVNGKVINYTKGDGTTGSITTQDTTYGVVSKTANGLAPKLPDETETTKYLRQDGTWTIPPDTKYSAATTSANGLMSSTDKVRVDNLYKRIAGYAVTAGTTSAYTASITGVTLTAGTMIALRFNAANAANATLNVNSLGAKPIYYKGAAITAGRAPKNAVMLLVYDTGQVADGAWHLVYSYDSNTTYSAMTGATETAAGKAGLVPAPPAGYEKRFLMGSGEWGFVTPKISVSYADDGTTSITLTGEDGMTRIAQETVSDTSAGPMTVAERSKLKGFQAASNYALKSDIAGMYKYKGSVTDASKLPTTGQTAGDVYNIEAASAYGGAGMNVAWNGSAWDPLGEIFTITAITNAEIDAICV